MLAERIGTSVHFVSLVERGINAPSFENIENLAAALDIEVHDLFDFRKTNQPTKSLRRRLRK